MIFYNFGPSFSSLNNGSYTKQFELTHSFKIDPFSESFTLQGCLQEVNGRKIKRCTHTLEFSEKVNPCILVDSSTVICWTSPIVILGVSGLFCRFYSSFDGKSS